MIETLIVLGAGFLTGITTILFGFGGGFVVVPFVYRDLRLGRAARPGDAYRGGDLDGGDDPQRELRHADQLAQRQPAA